MATFSLIFRRSTALPSAASRLKKKPNLTASANCFPRQPSKGEGPDGCWLLVGAAVGKLLAIISWPNVRPGPGLDVPIIFAVGGAIIGLFLDVAMRPTQKF